MNFLVRFASKTLRLLIIDLELSKFIFGAVRAIFGGFGALKS